MTTGIVHLARGPRFDKVWTPAFIDALQAIGPLTLHEHGNELSDEAAAELIRSHRVAIAGWDARLLPVDLANDPGALRYVCSYSGTIRHCVPRELIEAGIPVTNWGDLPAPGIAESAMTLLLTCVHDMARIRRAQEAGEWGYDATRAGTLHGLAVGVYGLGAIGRHFVEMLRPFGARIRAFDPYVATLPDNVERADSLDDLCEWAEALVIHAGLTAETQGSVGATQLARLPDAGIVVNTARGAIIDQAALFAEVARGRLRAGLDVLDPDHLDATEPLRQSENAYFTFHALTDEGGDAWPPRQGLTRLQQRCVDQIAAFAAGGTPDFLFDVDRFDRST